MWFLDQALPAFALVTSLLAAQPPLGGSPGKPHCATPKVPRFCRFTEFTKMQLT